METEILTTFLDRRMKNVSLKNKEKVYSSNISSYCDSVFKISETDQ